MRLFSLAIKGLNNDRAGCAQSRDFSEHDPPKPSAEDECYVGGNFGRKIC